MVEVICIRALSLLRLQETVVLVHAAMIFLLSHGLLVSLYSLHLLLLLEKSKVILFSNSAVRIYYLTWTPQTVANIESAMTCVLAI